MALKILSATGYAPIEKELYSIDGCLVIGTVTERQDAYDFCMTHKPDIMVISDYLPGEEKMIPFLLRFHHKYQDVRIIYLAQELNARNTAMIDALGLLVLNGIYDIIHEKNISIELIEDIINHPKTERSMSYLTERILGVESTVANNGFSYESSNDKEKHFEGIQNLYVVSSVKPGSGKSFVAANLAAACAKYGENIKVALIEADLQNLSPGTLLKMEEDDKNLMTALKTVDSIMQDGKVAVSIDETKQANEKILNCMKPYKGCKNLDVLVGSQLTFSDVNGDYISANGFIYLAEILSRYYDFLIVDTNSSLLHLSTLPLLKRARNCFYVLNIDFNNIRNNIKYQSVFEDIDVKDKLVYVLNQTIENGVGDQKERKEEEELLFTERMVKDKYFDIAIEIPALSRNVFLNRLYEGQPVVLDEDIPYTKDIKDAFLNLANMITPIKTSPDYIKKMEENEQEPESQVEEKKGLLSFLKGPKGKKLKKDK